MTFLEAINEVLGRLRESTVTTINQTSYSTMIGHFVNDTKRQVEDAWDWDAQNTTLSLTLTPGTTNYVLTGSGTKHKSADVNVTTSGRQAKLILVPMKWIQDQQQLTTTTPSSPGYWAWNGSNGVDSKVEIYPTPDTAYTLAFNLNVPQVSLSSASDVILVPSEVVVLGAYARALAERGEDGALASSEAYGLFKGALSDRIALEQARALDYSEWVAV